MNFNSFGHYKPWKIRFKKKIRFKNISLERRYSRLQVTFLSRYFFKKNIEHMQMLVDTQSHYEYTKHETTVAI